MTAGWRWIRSRNWPRPDLNPVVVKELRQAVRSWFVTGVLLLFLSVLLVTMLAFLASQTTHVSPDQGIGQEIFQMLVVILAGACFLFIPLYTGIRLAMERQEINLDLLYVTTLSPGRIIRGKFLCGVYLTILFFSACMPFMVLTNLLRGVDMPTIALVLGLIFACTCGAIQLAIFISCLPVSNQFKALLMLPTFGYLIALTALIGATSQNFLQAGFLSLTGRGIVTTSAIYVLALGWFHLCSIALISPRSMNRALPLRLFASLVWLVSGLLLAWWAWKESQGILLRVWLYFSLLLIIVALIVTVSQPDTLSLRVRQKIPRARWKRFPAFFFFNGAAQGLAWLWAISFLTLIGFQAFREFDLRWNAAAAWNRSGIPVEELLVLLALGLYAYAYTMTGLFLHRTFFAQRTPLLASFFAFIIPALWTIVPNFILFLFNRLSWNVIEQRQLGNAFNLLLVNDGALIRAHLWFAAGWAGLAVVANLPWFCRQVRAFQPLERTENPPPP